jgi:sterol desaturase/sphingolipid hydroxylase (fatty acid hydroxylase superfamily)
MLLFTVSIFLIVFFRYLFLAAAYHWWTRSRKKNPFQKRQLLRELRWSVASSLIFSILTILTFYVYQAGYTRVYRDFNSYSVVYFLLSILIYLVLYETYYYWLHRWMHMPGVFRKVHKVHHESVHTSAFTSFSFHPIEAFLQFLFLPLMILVLPIHYSALGIILLLMTVSAVINHAGVEVYPKKFYKHPIGKWLIGSTHHDLHHREFKANYGLYFTFWDKWMRTESSEYEKRFENNTGVNRSQ